MQGEYQSREKSSQAGSTNNGSSEISPVPGIWIEGGGWSGITLVRHAAAIHYCLIRPGAEKVHPFCHKHILVVDSGSDQNRIAGASGIDPGLYRGLIARDIDDG